MSDASAHDHHRDHHHAHAAPPPPHFRFESFADAPSAQAAFAAAFPPGSPAEVALQALVDMGAQCKSVAPGKVACRYVENEGALIGWCWHIAFDATSERLVQRVVVNLSVIGA